MSASNIATLPRSGNGRPLLAVVGEVFKELFAARKARVATNPAPANGMSFWELYRLSVGHDSISPKVAAELRRKLVGNE